MLTCKSADNPKQGCTMDLLELVAACFEASLCCWNRHVGWENCLARSGVFEHLSTSIICVEKILLRLRCSGSWNTRIDFFVWKKSIILGLCKHGVLQIKHLFWYISPLTEDMLLLYFMCNVAAVVWNINSLFLSTCWCIILSAGILWISLWRNNPPPCKSIDSITQVSTKVDAGTEIQPPLRKLCLLVPLTAQEWELLNYLTPIFRTCSLWV